MNDGHAHPPTKPLRAVEAPIVVVTIVNSPNAVVSSSIAIGAATSESLGKKLESALTVLGKLLWAFCRAACGL